MAGAPYEAGGIRATTAATRAAGDDGARARSPGARRREALARRHHPRRDQVRLRARRRDRGALLRDRRARSPTTSPSSAPTSCPTEYAGRADDYVELVCGDDARRLRAARPLDRRLLRGRRLRRRPVRAPCSSAGRAAGLGLRVHANQLGPGPGVQLAVELGAASADHCTHLTDADVEALAGERHRRHVPAGHRLLHPPALPRRPPRDRRRRDRRARDELQPRLELHDLDGVLHRARRPRHADDDRRGARRRHARRRAGAAPRRRSATSRRARAPTPSCSTRPRTTHLVYRPGVPLVAATIAAGRPAWKDGDFTG